MKVDILEFVDGAEKARGLTVIIDVFRAFSVTCYLIDMGAERIIPVEKITQAFKLKQENPDIILLGERHEKKVDGFDFGNSPSEFIGYDLTGKSIVHTTSAGTKGLTKAVKASEIITGSFVNVKAIIQYILRKKPEKVSLVAMGYKAEITADEDILCAQYIKNELEGKPNDFEEMKTIIKKGTGKRFFNPANTKHSPPADFDLCLYINKFSFVLKAEKNNNCIELKPIYL